MCVLKERMNKVVNLRMSKSAFSIDYRKRKHLNSCLSVFLDKSHFPNKCNGIAKKLQ